MIRNLYTIVDGPYMGQGAIIIEQRESAPQWFNAITWPNARLIVVSKRELENPQHYELLDNLPPDVFEPYQASYYALIKRQTNAPTT